MDQANIFLIKICIKLGLMVDKEISGHGQMFSRASASMPIWPYIPFASISNEHQIKYNRRCTIQCCLKPKLLAI